MILLALIGAGFFIALIFGPQMWIKWTMAEHGRDRPDYPGTGGELALQLLKEAGLEEVKVEITDQGDHYSPVDKAVRLSEQHFNGRSVTAVAVAAHEVSHAVQDASGYGPLHLRQRLLGTCVTIERTGSLVLMATPFVFALTKSPVVLAAEIAVAIIILASTVVIHLVTLPTELDASFNRAMPALTHYLPADDLPAARKVLRAAAFTYVASALVSLLDFARLIRILRP
jgi:Zn-dependent membrane protease YugP